LKIANRIYIKIFITKIENFHFIYDTILNFTRAVNNLPVKLLKLANLSAIFCWVMKRILSKNYRFEQCRVKFLSYILYNLLAEKSTQSTLFSLKNSKISKMQVTRCVFRPRIRLEITYLYFLLQSNRDLPHMTKNTISKKKSVDGILRNRPQVGIFRVIYNKSTVFNERLT
jgi:hypothetical protein